MALQFLEVFVICQLHLVRKVDHVRQKLLIVHLVVHGILYAAVEVYCQHALRASRHAARTKRIAEAVVLYLVSQSAA